jgi:parallel beta-helix repeat protein
MFKSRNWIVSILALIATLPVLAAEGRIPIFSSPTTIATSGRYFVSRNLSSGGPSIITITADDVDIDLNGFVLDGTGSVNPVVAASGVDGVTIRNGTILGGSRSIEIANGERVVIEDVEADGATGIGIFLDNTTAFAIRRVVFRNTFSTALRANGGASPATGTVEHNLVESCAEGFRLENVESVAVLNNRLRNIQSHGIIVLIGSACLVSGNTLEQVGPGIRMFSSNSTISHNVVSNAANTGLEISGSDNLVLNNLVTRSGNRGIQIGGDRNHFEGNVSNSNGGHGFAFAGDNNVYRGNTARGNGGTNGSPAGCVAQCSPDLCIYTGSTGNTSNLDNYLPAAPCN